MMVPGEIPRAAAPMPDDLKEHNLKTVSIAKHRPENLPRLRLDLVTNLFSRLILIGTLALLLQAWPLAAQDRFFDSNGVQIRYIDQGAGEPIVLIHGLLGNIEGSWGDIGIIASLSKDHRVIAFDVRGHGKSGKPSEADAYGQQMCLDIVRLLDHLKIQRAHIVGYSNGGRIVAKLLTTNPERFLTATMGGSSGTRTWGPADEKAAQDQIDELTKGIPFQAAILSGWPADQPPPTEDVIRARSEAIVARGNDPLAHAALARTRRALLVTNDEMAAVKVPTLAIVGSADRMVNGVREIQRVMNGLKVVVIEGARHEDAPRRPEFVNALREFIAAHPQTSNSR
jgi:pimeloyl-ACP methyl ester carboxylesterase